VKPDSRAASGLPQPTTAQLDAAVASRVKLLEGVKSIPRLGAPGVVVAYGPLAFPLLTAADNNVQVAIAAAAPMGQGRAVIFGHTGYVSGGPEASQGDLERLLLNCVRWASGKEKPRVGCKGSKLAAVLAQAGMPATNYDKFDRKLSHSFDVVIISAQNLDDPAESVALQEFVEGGGGLIAGVTAWAYGQTSGGRDFATAHLGNPILAAAGLAWSTGSISAGTSPLLPLTDAAPMLNALTAVDALQPKLNTPPPAAALVDQGAKTIQLALESMPAASRAAFQPLLAALVAGDEHPIIPTPEKPLLESANPNERAHLSIEARLAKFLAPNQIKANPAAVHFPGRVTANTPAVTKAIPIDPNIPGWQSTGLYADAGATITVRIPADEAAQGYTVRIGCHTDTLYHLEKWPRVPEITSVTPLQAVDTAAANAFGGLIYIVVPEKPKSTKPFNAIIAGGVEAPYFVLGQTTDQQWQQLRQLHAPWAELACNRLIVSIPTSVAREVQNPTEVMKLWQRVVDAEDELANVAAERRRPERIVADVLISAGYMHSGYPIMIHLPQAKEMVTVSKTTLPGWGFYHELGHNHQKPAWTFDGTVEVTCNIFSLYISEVLEGKSRPEAHSAITTESQTKKWIAYKRIRTPYAEWKADPFLAFGTYIDLIDGFGWDVMKKVLRSYQTDELGQQPKGDDEKRDQWMIRYSKIAGKNLGPFFDAWGIPVSASAKAEIANLPGWMPQGKS
jgi:hypothetical protein